jgi:hypothetical protein
MEGLCPNHDFPVKHLFKDCDLFKRYLKGELVATHKGKRAEPIKKNKEEDAFLRLKGCLMIFEGPAAYELKHRHKLTARKVNTTTSPREAVLTYLKLSEAAITFD